MPRSTSVPRALPRRPRPPAARGKTIEERTERDVALQPRERRAEAEVDAPPERQVAVRRTRDIERVGLGELRGVAVRRAGGATAVWSLPRWCVRRPRRSRARSAPRPARCCRSAGTPRRPRAAARAPRASRAAASGCSVRASRPLPMRFVVVSWAGEEQQDRERQQLVVREALAVLLGLHERRHDVGARGGAALRDDLVHVGDDLDGCPARVGEHVRGVEHVRHVRDGRRPLLEAVAVARGGRRGAPRLR